MTTLLLFGMFGAPAAWAAQLLASYAIVAHACFPDGRPLETPAFGGARPVALIVSLVALAVAVTALATASAKLRLLDRNGAGHDAGPPDAGHGRARFMALAGMLLGAMFTFALVMNTMPLITQPVCRY